MPYEKELKQEGMRATSGREIRLTTLSSCAG